MAQIRISKSKATLLIIIGMAFILPISSLVLSIIFHNDITIDKPKIVEEALKGVVSLLISITAVMVSNAYTTKETQKKLEALQVQMKSRLLSIKENLIELVNSDDLLDKATLENSQANIIRKNFNNEVVFKTNVQRISSDLEKIHQSIINSDPEIGIGCQKFSNSIISLIIAINDYIAMPETMTAKKIKDLASNLLTTMEE